MYGYDQFAIKHKGKIVAERRGGYFLIALRVYVKKENFAREILDCFPEQLNRFKKQSELKFTEYPSLKEYSKADGDVLFYCTPKGLYTVEKQGRKKEIRWKRR